MRRVRAAAIALLIAAALVAWTRLRRHSEARLLPGPSPEHGSAPEARSAGTAPRGSRGDSVRPSAEAMRAVARLVHLSLAKGDERVERMRPQFSQEELSAMLRP